jgi:hypothetical protein
MSFAMIIGAATSRFRGRAGRAARRRVAARTAVSRPDGTVLLLLALYACWGSAIPAMKLMGARDPTTACSGPRPRACKRSRHVESRLLEHIAALAAAADQVLPERTQSRPDRSPRHSATQ